MPNLESNGLANFWRNPELQSGIKIEPANLFYREVLEITFIIHAPLLKQGLY